MIMIPANCNNRCFSNLSFWKINFQLIFIWIIVYENKQVDKAVCDFDITKHEIKCLWILYLYSWHVIEWKMLSYLCTIKIHLIFQNKYIPINQMEWNGRMVVGKTNGPMEDGGDQIKQEMLLLLMWILFKLI